MKEMTWTQTQFFCSSFNNKTDIISTVMAILKNVNAANYKSTNSTAFSINYLELN